MRGLAKAAKKILREEVDTTIAAYEDQLKREEAQ
jgi:hypothetical protein